MQYQRLQTLENLKKIANTGLTVFDLDFLRRFTTNLCYSKLQPFSILLPANIPEVVKIHDLICTAMNDHPEHIEIVQRKILFKLYRAIYNSFWI